MTTTEPTTEPVTDATREAANTALNRLGTPPMVTDPYPLYDELRSAGRVFPSAQYPGLWAVTGYREVAEVMRMQNTANGPAAAAKWREDWADHESMRLYLSALVCLDAPDHTRVRGAAGHVFTPNAIQKMREVVERLAAKHLDDLAEQGAGGRPVDLIDVLASRFPVAVIAEMLGVPDDQAMLFYELANGWTRVWAGYYTEEDLAGADRAATQLRGYFSELLDERARNPREDLLSGLAARRGQDGMSEDELLGLASFLFVAGFETTTNFIGNAVHALWEFPDQQKLLRDDPSLTPKAIEELLRHGTPIVGASRVATEPTLLGGQEIPPGHFMWLILAAANRDPLQYPDPAKLDFTRDQGPHLSFSGGPHFCMGAALARMETQVLFPALLERFKTIEVVGTPEKRTGLGLIGYEHLPVVVG
ncbi:cytochrome P450 family 164 [Kitasatospora sp. Ki12]|uniref:cytochrome P450 n=1 Tax=Kitasatospora xanthocidica TaxID=83382 RepID=UPI001679ADAD|nr:cytochrome P450 [Kitasatospora xanthocidica]GHF89359.1 cytochrome P450 [Kitasatospora xanthocidica]